MTPGYITLDWFDENTRDVSGWRATHPHLVRHDPSEPTTAEVYTVPVGRHRGQVMAPTPRGYRGSRRRRSVLRSMVIGAALMVIFMCVVALGALIAWQFIIPTLFGG